MRIELTRGMFAEIDEEDFSLIRGHRWIVLQGGNGYIYAVTHVYEDGKRKSVLMHRLIMGVTDRRRLIDHKDGDGLNNRRSNMRECDHGQNMKNRKLHAQSKTGIKGVAFEKHASGLMRPRGKVISDGKRYRKWFSSVADAEVWVKEMRKKLHGEFAYEASRALPSCQPEQHHDLSISPEP